MPPPARSNTGCWTCRIRRKKCDDIKPTCGPCTLRYLTCHGYGPKPTWMDSGENQRAEIERIKRAVNQSFKSRIASRLSRKSSPHSSSLGSARSTGNGNLESLTVDLMSQNIPNIGILRLENGPTQRKQVPFPLVEPWPKLPATAEQSLAPRFQHFPGASDLSNAVIEVYQTPQNFEPEPNSYIPATEQVRAMNLQSTFSFLPDVLPAANDEEFGMIMHYLDDIIPLRFYFYQPSSPERGRGWLLNLLLRAKASYFTALAFSVLHQIIYHYNGDSVMTQKLFPKFDEYHSIAIAHLQQQLDYLPTALGPEHLKVGVEILACSMELMSIEVFRETKEFRGPRGDWEVHLQAAGALIDVIGTELRSSSSDDSSVIQASDAENSKKLLPLNDIAGLDFFITCFIWSDISRCASIGMERHDRVYFPYLTYLEEDRVRLDHMMGCQNWAMLIVKEISDLEAWKFDMQKQRSLSLPLLSGKSVALEQRLNNGLGSVLDGFDNMTKYERECSLVTQIWALSALTYLAVVVSGNSELLPEVRYSVPRTLQALEALPTHLLIRVSWAFCVAGCMAHSGEMDDFKQLLYTAHENGNILGTLWNALEIMEESWALRKEEEQKANGTPWAISMDNLGLKILLI